MASVKTSIKSRNGYKLQIGNELARVKKMLEGDETPDMTTLKRVRSKIQGYLDTITELDNKILNALE